MLKAIPESIAYQMERPPKTVNSMWMCQSQSLSKKEPTQLVPMHPKMLTSVRIHSKVISAQNVDISIRCSNIDLLHCQHRHLNIFEANFMNFLIFTKETV